MDKAAYFLFFLCGIISQGVCHLSKENNEKSSDFLIRQKRIVGGTSRRIAASPFLLNVLRNENDHCPASLLTADVAITSATCFINENTQNMKILSHSTGGKIHHEIVRVIFLDPHFDPAQLTVKNLALVRFMQPINFETSYNRPIGIYTGFLATERLTSLVVSWGKPRIERGRKIPSDNLRSFGAVVISFEYCRHIYHNLVGNGNICAVGNLPGEYCETTRDSGIPLIMNNQLLGIFVYHGRSRQSNPDVYMNLLDHDIRHWIHQHVPSLRLF